MEDSLNLDEILTDRVRNFEEAEDTTRVSRVLSERCRDYRDNKQWTPDEESKIKKRGQPVVTFNEIAPKINTMIGLEKQTRKDPKAFPRNPQDEASANAATDAIRYVCEDSRWDDKRSRGAEELAVEGTCAIMVGVKETRSGIDPDIRRIAWDRFYYDPASSEFDFADAKFMGIVIWMDYDDALRRWPDAKEYLDSTLSRSRASDTYDDKPKTGMWADYKRKRVRICEEYYNESGWKFCIYTQAGFLEKPQDSPYLDDESKPECPIKAVSLYIDRENNRYGEVVSMLSPQDEVNKRRSKALHLISQRQVRVDPATGLSPIEVRKELSRPDGVFMGAAGEVEVFQTSDMAAGNLNLMQDARAHIHRSGSNNALAGKDTQNQSGKAIIAQQQGGMTEGATYLDTVRVLSLAVYRSVWARVQQFWKEERWIRVTDDQRNIRFVGLNRPVTALKAAAKKLGVDPDNLEQADPQAVQMLQAYAQDPSSQQVVGVENNVGELDVDIIVDEGIDTPTIAAEQFSELVKMLPTFGPMAQDPKIIEVVIEASSLRDKSKLLDILNGGQQAQGNAMQAQMQAAQQQAQQEGQIEIEKANVKAGSDVEVAKIKAATDIQIAQIKAAAESEIKSQQMRVDAFIEANKPAEQAA